METKESRCMFKEDGAVRSLAWSPDGSQLASGAHVDITQPLAMKIWDPTNASLIKKFDVPGSNYILQLVFSPSGKELAAAFGNGQVRVWEVATQASWSFKRTPKATARRQVAQKGGEADSTGMKVKNQKSRVEFLSNAALEIVELNTLSKSCHLAVVTQ